MNFNEAVKLMREGRVVKRKKSDHLYRANRNIETNEEVFMFYILDKWRGSDWIFSVQDFEAIDWEVME